MPEILARRLVSDTLLSKTIASTATLKIANIPWLDLFYTPLEERFERITRIARRALHAPVAAISLLNEDKQWFKSAAGWGISELRARPGNLQAHGRSKPNRHDRRHAGRSARREAADRGVGAAVSRLRRSSARSTSKALALERSASSI